MQGRQQLGLAKVGRAGAGTVVLPALALLARVVQVALRGAHTIVYVVPRRAALPSGGVEGQAGERAERGVRRPKLCRKPSPPRRASGNARRRASVSLGSASSTLSPNSTSRHRQTASSWPRASLAIRSGGRVRKMWSACGEAHMERRSHAHWRSGSSVNSCACRCVQPCLLGARLGCRGQRTRVPLPARRPAIRQPLARRCQEEQARQHGCTLTVVLPRFAATPARVSMEAVTTSSASRERAGAVTK